MALHRENMQDVPDWGEVLPEGWYHVRVTKGEERDSDNTPGARVFAMNMTVQEEPFVGRVIFDPVSLQSHALAKLKAYYKAAGYTPGPEGHDPEWLVENHAEFYVQVTHDVYQGQTRMKVAPWGIRSLRDGKPA